MSRFFKLSTQHPALITLWPYLSIVVLTLIFFYKLAFTGMILGRGDIYAYFYPYWSVRNAALMAGQIPLWSPDIFMGVPVLANSQVGLFYPLNWPLTPFDAPTAITISLLVHVALAIMGAYVLARRTLNLEQFPALVAAVVFGLGGYMGAKVENINQLQALAWMPWLFTLLYRGLEIERTRYIVSLRYVLIFGIVLALQLLAGHPQTVFISLFGLGIYGLVLALAKPAPSRRARLFNLVRLVLMLGIGGVIAVLLAAPQLIPTLELQRQSNRSGGLLPQQAMAFSLNPYVIGRGMLPSYDGLLFGEYIGYAGIIGLGLAVIGIFNTASSTRDTDVTRDAPPPRLRGGGWGVGYRLPWIILIVLGFGLALGLYNPIYWSLTSLPGFSFFRVPARWLALFALAAGMLAGIGLQSLQVKRPARWMIGLIVGLVGTLAAATSVTNQMAMDVIGPADPTGATWLGWIIALAGLLVGLVYVPRRKPQVVVPFLGLLAMVELFAASRVLAYNATVPPDTFSAQRFTISQLRAYGAEQTPPGRTLGISQLFFDPGDVTALTARYRDWSMSDLAIRIALVDTKMKEFVAPNLSLIWGIPTIDGFDGGLLPTGNYSAFTSLMLPPGEEPTTDGRLREILAREECLGACIPDLRWLNLTNTRYLITDKVFDEWSNDIAYDTTFEFTLEAGESLTIDDIPAFEADSVHLLCRETGGCAPIITFIYEDGTEETLSPFQDSVLASYLASKMQASEPRTPVSIRIEATESNFTPRALTLVDSRTGDFQQITFPPWQRVMSSDIKLYENQTVSPRAFLVNDVLTAPDNNAVLDLMRDPAFDPSESVVIIENDSSGSLNTPPSDSGEDARGSVNITSYEPERVEIQVSAAGDSLLVLTDAYYPGWVATVNGETVPIHRADVMFRAVPVPAGESTVIFTYQPGWWPGVLIFGAAAWLAALVGLTVLLRFRGCLKSLSKNAGFSTVHDQPQN